MKTHYQQQQQQPKLKTQLLSFSCGFFRQCSQTVLSPTATPPNSNSHPLTFHSSESSSSTTSQSFTQWRFSPQTTNHNNNLIQTHSNPTTIINPSSPPPLPLHNLQELFHISELQLTTDTTTALNLLERSLVPNPPQNQPPCPPNLMRAITANLAHAAKPATKILFALCISHTNRLVAVQSGAVSAVLEAAPDLHGAPAERALASLELMCTLPDAAQELRAHALAVPVLVTMMAKTAARGKEYAIGVLAVVYGGDGADQQTAPPEEVARAVELALQGECSARGRRKGAQLLKTLQQLSQPEIIEAAHEPN